ncbi:hypothetical protein HF272_13640 [Rhizobium leguminosarum]|uniref:hypothetical protein n=1 Tax=Rhizobium leguminosarum TaxID=384 RepID=UPI001C90E5BA|nr:hypothetical protein [Rhizobium leguminosarum]MBY2992472.1 hypothetical protein [Rhizobium leguminosarum]
MSSLALHVADKPPEDPAELTGFYTALLAILNAEARERHGWEGSVIANLGVLDGYVFVEIRPGEAFATIDDLRAFRKRQIEEEKRAEEPPKQSRLI